jgi:hypothetical protein
MREWASEEWHAYVRMGATSIAQQFQAQAVKKHLRRGGAALMIAMNKESNKCWCRLSMACANLPELAKKGSSMICSMARLAF